MFRPEALVVCAVLGTSRMAVEKLKVACTISGAQQFGSTVLIIRRSVPAPATRGSPFVASARRAIMQVIFDEPISSAAITAPRP